MHFFLVKIAILFKHEKDYIMSSSSVNILTTGIKKEWQWSIQTLLDCESAYWAKVLVA